MSTIINIADIPLVIRGRDFLKYLTPVEKRILRPFISHRSIPSLHRSSYVVNIKIIKKARVLDSGPFNPTLVSAIKTRVVCPDRHRFMKNFEQYLRSIFYGDESQLRKFAGALKARGKNGKVMLAEHSFFVVDKISRNVCIYMPETEPLETMRSILKTLFQIIIVEEGGVLLHASSVEEEGLGYIFAGRSEAGKTTTAKIGKFNKILSDDITIIRKINSSYMIYSNPWWNAWATDIPRCKEPVFLKAIFFIKKSNKTGMRKMGLKEAMAKLMYEDYLRKCICFYRTPLEVKNFYLFSIKLVRDIMVFELCVKKGRKFSSEFRSLLRQYID